MTKPITFEVQIKAPQYTAKEVEFADYDKARNSAFALMHKVYKCGKDAEARVVMVDESARGHHRETILMRFDGDYYAKRLWNISEGGSR